MKSNIREMFSIFSDWYWEFPRAIRVRIGWIGLLLFVLLGFSFLWGTYQVGVGVVQWTCSLFTASDNSQPSDDLHYPFNPPKRDYKNVVRYDKKNLQYARVFNDLNDVQLAAARSLGISPIDGREDVDKQNHRLVELHSCSYYKLDNMTHSIPFLVPEASDFLSELGLLFQHYSQTSDRFIITSVLRTRGDVKRLRRSGNANASENSCHFYATTFDITYNRFDKHSRIWDGKLKDSLAKALYDLREAGYCYVKYERRQACFHVTVRR